MKETIQEELEHHPILLGVLKSVLEDCYPTYCVRYDFGPWNRWPTIEQRYNGDYGAPV